MTKEQQVAAAARAAKAAKKENELLANYQNLTVEKYEKAHAPESGGSRGEGAEGGDSEGITRRAGIRRLRSGLFFRPAEPVSTSPARVGARQPSRMRRLNSAAPRRCSRAARYSGES